jgi:hypothetical protein
MVEFPICIRGKTVTYHECTSASARRNNPMCTDAYGAAMVTVDELRWM